MDGSSLLGAGSPAGSSDDLSVHLRPESADDVLHNETLASYARSPRASIHQLRERNVATKEREATYESLDYDIVETNLHVISQRSHDSRKYLAMHVRARRWALTALVGVFTALVACFIDFGVKELNGLTFGIVFELIQQGKAAVEKEEVDGNNLHYFWVPLLTFVGICCAPHIRHPTCDPTPNPPRKRP